LARLAAPISLCGSLARKCTELTATSWPAHSPVRPASSLTSPLVGTTFGSAAIFSGFRAMAVTL
jgi:hypothetical protein